MLHFSRTLHELSFHDCSQYGDGGALGMRRAENSVPAWMALLTGALLALLAGCAATPRGNAENACSFMFLSGLPAPINVIAMAALCSFGLEALPDGEDDDES